MFLISMKPKAALVRTQDLVTVHFVFPHFCSHLLSIDGACASLVDPLVSEGAVALGRCPLSRLLLCPLVSVGKQYTEVCCCDEVYHVSSYLM